MNRHRITTARGSLVAIALLGGCLPGGSSGAPLPVPGFVDVRLAGPAPDTIPPEVIARGDSIFHGRLAGAVCFSCHGADAKGTPGVAPNLTDDRWLHGDGSLAFLQRIIASGVPQAKESPMIMPPYGGTPLPPDQLRAVAAYVHSLRGKGR